jgi:curved DNA-binding protein CbpA
MGLALDAVLTPAQLRSAYARAAFRLHPDYGGTHEQMSELNAAMLAAKRELGVP